MGKAVTNLPGVTCLGVSLSIQRICLVFSFCRGSPVNMNYQKSRATFHFHSESRDPNLFRKSSKTRGNSWLLNRTIVEKNGDASPRKHVGSNPHQRKAYHHNVSVEYLLHLGRGKPKGHPSP